MSGFFNNMNALPCTASRIHVSVTKQWLLSLPGQRHELQPINKYNYFNAQTNDGLLRYS